ncbi:hypothetical protein A2223_04170, partial [Candidatus Falkowbacteria bacterium RIFOXYA2_FULL_35_8]
QEKQENQSKKYLSVAELAKILGVSRITVFNRIKKGQIPAEKIGRIYAIPMEYVNKLATDDLSEEKKEEIKKAVEKAVKEYGKTLELLGKE